MMHFPNSALVHAPTVIHNESNLVNWGRGRLLPYESHVSFFLKFCNLNGLSMSFARKYLEINHCMKWSNDGFEILDHQRLAKLLDEEEDLTKKLNRSYLDLTTCLNIQGSNIYLNDIMDRQTSSYRLSYCPECIKSGYHASFHDFRWLSKCPIHSKVELIIYREFAKGNFDTFRKHTQIFNELIEEHCPNWLSIHKNAYIHRSCECTNLVSFREWVISAQNIVAKINENRIGSIQGDAAVMDTQEVFLNRIFALFPPPKNIESLLIIEKRLTKAVEYITVDQECMQMLKDITSKLPYVQFRDFYRKHLILSNKQTNFRKKATELIDSILQMDNPCGCKWLKDNREHWWQNSQSNTSKCRDTSIKRALGVCPLEEACDKLLIDWVDVVNASAKSRLAFWDTYVRLSSTFEKYDWLKITHEQVVPNFLEPIGELCLPNKLNEFLDEILCLEIKYFSDRLAYLIKTARGDTPPFEVEPLFNSIELIAEKSHAYILKWS